MKLRACIYTSLLALMVFAVVTACTRTPEVQPTSRKISPADLRFDPANSTAVISSAQKFIVPVAQLDSGGEPLVYPKGHEEVGKPNIAAG